MRNSRYSVSVVQPGLWRIVFYLPAPVNVWLVQQRDGLTLIDAAQPWNAGDILSVVSEINLPLREIIITHAHPDHAGAAATLSAQTGAVVMAHALDANFLLGRCSLSEENGYWLCRAVLGFGKRLKLLDPPPVSSVELVSDGDQVGSLSIIHTPGHTPGSISIWWKDEAAVFCGDNVVTSFGSLRIGLPWFTLDHAVQRRGIEKYIRLNARALLPGHGPAFKGDIAQAIQRFK